MRGLHCPGSTCLTCAKTCQVSRITPHITHAMSDIQRVNRHNIIPTIIDCDIHNAVPTWEQLMPFLEPHWQEFVTQSDFKGPAPNTYAAGIPFEGQPQTQPGDGEPAGSDLALVRKHIFDSLNVKYGILNCAYAAEAFHNPYAIAALVSAVNDWQIAEWLDPEPRLLASLVVPSQDPELAANEIHRLGAHPQIVQVYLPARSTELYGTRRFHPIYRAAAEYDLVIGIHFGGAPGAPPTASGWSSYYIEEYAGMSHIFQSQLTSLIMEGAFAEFPSLKIALIASGFTWLPGLMWRLDKEWKGLRREIPWVKKLPSEYIYERVRLTLQPVDAPPDAYQFGQILDQMGCEDLLMFSTDYPYNYFETEAEAFPFTLPANLTRKIMSDNALNFYNFNGNEVKP